MWENLECLIDFNLVNDPVFCLSQPMWRSGLIMQRMLPNTAFPVNNN